MDWLIPLIVVLVVVVAAAVALKTRSREAEAYPYVMTRALFSPAERSFLGVLDDAIGQEYRVFGKVRVADIVEPQWGLDRSNRQTALNRTQAKHFDFVLCAQTDLSVVCVIELDDRSHQAQRRQERDAFLAGLCAKISLPLVRISVQRTYSVPEVRAKVEGALSAWQQAMPEGRAEPPRQPVTEVPGEPFGPVIGRQPLRTEAEEAAVAEPQAPSCPKCSQPMVQRRAKVGANAGKVFWGCSRFPTCRGTIP
jgi:hypothetical protein